jgi:hypothetical protein
MDYEQREINTEYTGTAGFVIVTVESSPQKRGGSARVFVTGPRPEDVAEFVAATSSADNFVADVISSQLGSCTVPVPSRAKWKVVVSGDADVRVLFIALREVR